MKCVTVSGLFFIIFHFRVCCDLNHIVFENQVFSGGSVFVYICPKFVQFLGLFVIPLDVLYHARLLVVFIDLLVVIVTAVVVVEWFFFSFSFFNV